MEECPHCGEPIEEYAESCAHCGSDFETGWKPDVDYFSVDLPEDESSVSQAYLQHAPRITWDGIVSWFLVFASAMLFLWAGAKLYQAVFLLFVVPLAACFLIFHRILTAGKRMH
ncbi:MAG TPA: zinc ribbon domain-containing protein [Planctomycetota bacterium]|nr:zinc ribbon domain-containing protein [Planctomycetota bacterium]